MSQTISRYTCILKISAYSIFFDFCFRNIVLKILNISKILFVNRKFDFDESLII